MLKVLLGFVTGAIFAMFVIAYFYPRIEYKNTLETTNGVISLYEGIEGINLFPDIPARVLIRIKQVRPNKNGICDIKTGVVEEGFISLEHLNMLDHFAHRYLEKKDDGYSGGCRLIINDKEVEGKDLN